MTETSWKRTVGDLSQKVAESDLAQKQREAHGIESSFQKPPCYWSCILQNDIDSGLTDWEPEFSQNSTTTAVSYRVPFRIATGGGELNSPHPNGGSGYGSRLHRITVYALQPQDIVYALGFTGSSTSVQLKVNGAITTISGATDTNGTFALPAGYSTISIASRLTVDSIMFWALLFDGVNLFWVDPNESRYPTRDGFSQSNFGGLPPTSQPTAPSGAGPS